MGIFDITKNRIRNGVWERRTLRGKWKRTDRDDLGEVIMMLWPQEVRGKISAEENRQDRDRPKKYEAIREYMRGMGGINQRFSTYGSRPTFGP